MKRELDIENTESMRFIYETIDKLLKVTLDSYKFFGQNLQTKDHEGDAFLDTVICNYVLQCLFHFSDINNKNVFEKNAEAFIKMLQKLFKEAIPEMERLKKQEEVH